MSTQNVLTYGWNGTNPQRTEVNTSGHQKVNVENASIAITSSGTLNVSDSTAQASLSSIDGKVTACNTSAVTIVANTSGVGDATAANQATANGHLSTIAGAVSGTEMQVDIVTGSVSVSNNTDPASATKQDQQTSHLSTIAGAVSGTEMQVDIVTGSVSVSNNTDPATATKQDTAQASLTALEGSLYQDGDAVGASDVGVLVMGRNGTNAAKPIHITANGDVEVEIADFVKGQTTMSASFPVVVASDQSTLNTDPVATRASSTLFNAQSILTGSSATSSVLDMDGLKEFQIIGNTTNTGFDDFKYEYSADNITWFRSSDEFISVDSTSGDFSHRSPNTSARYVRFYKANTSGVTETITLIACTRKN